MSCTNSSASILFTRHNTTSSRKEGAQQNEIASLGEIMTTAEQYPVKATGLLSGSMRYVTMAYALEQLAHHLPAAAYPSRLDILGALLCGRQLCTPTLKFEVVK
jgi:hypothetical protein